MSTLLWFFLNFGIFPPDLLTTPSLSASIPFMKFNGKKLRIILLEKEVSLITVTKALGLSKHNLSRWVNGNNSPQVGEVMNILRFLGYSDSEAKEVFWSLYS